MGSESGQTTYGQLIWAGQAKPILIQYDNIYNTVFSTFFKKIPSEPPSQLIHKMIVTIIKKM